MSSEQRIAELEAEVARLTEANKHLRYALKFAADRLKDFHCTATCSHIMREYRRWK